MEARTSRVSSMSACVRLLLAGEVALEWNRELGGGEYLMEGVEQRLVSVSTVSGGPNITIARLDTIQSIVGDFELLCSG